jgi:hypothetical protein
MATENVMLDIETLSTATDALVLSIGATQFDSSPTGPKFGDEILLCPDIKEQLILGRQVDRSTQLWWKSQSAAAKAHWLDARPETIYSVRSALSILNQFVSGFEKVWARGPHFDVSILQSLYEAVGMTPEWRYNGVRDVRTFCSETPVLRNWEGARPLHPKHHPLRDNHEQIVDLWEHGYQVVAPPTDNSEG